MAREDVQVIEKGDIYFFIRPDTGTRDIKGLFDVQRFYVVLNPDEDSKFREMVVGQKKLPDIEHEERFWGFVDGVYSSPDELREELGGDEYDTRTRGTQHVMPARAVGEGRYAIAQHADHSHLTYALELPKEPKQVQEDLRIEHEGSYIISVRNPKAGDFRSGGEPNYPDEVLEEFDPDNKWARQIDPKMLNYEHAEFILIGGGENPEEELGIELDTHSESLSQSDLVQKLKLEKGKKLLEPIEKGEWD